ncbi:hypothetical protein PybrP1_013061 [[Pythium] brassicae (nom. inval.)]|nr:hypothetical protein PybrP1_013061 [[Pythium] brassicae (nom. inval.)]
MGNKLAPGGSARDSDRASSLSSYVSNKSERRYSRRLSLDAAVTALDALRATIGRGLDGVGVGRLEEEQEEEGEGERIPDDVTRMFAFNRPVDGKMHRNLCGCAHRHMRVDVMGVTRSSGKCTLYVNRQCSLQAPPNELVGVDADLEFMSYLATRFDAHEKRGHPHLVELLGHFCHAGVLHIATKYYELGNLHEMLRRTASRSLSPQNASMAHHFRTDEAIRRMLRDIFQGVAFVHCCGVAHLDLALENIYLGVDGRCRVGDFRHARFVGTANKRHAAPSPARSVYAAPELHSGRNIDLLKADAWSLGVLALIVLTLETPFAEATPRDPKYQALQLGGVPKVIEDMSAATGSRVAIPQDILDMLSGLLCCDPERRSSVRHVVDLNPWLQAGETEFVSRTVGVDRDACKPRNADTRTETEPETSTSSSPPPPLHLDSTKNGEHVETRSAHPSLNERQLPPSTKADAAQSDQHL